MEIANGSTKTTCLHQRPLSLARPIPSTSTDYNSGVNVDDNRGPKKRASESLLKCCSLRHHSPST
jgi:hypothetical protein